MAIIKFLNCLANLKEALAHVKLRKNLFRNHVFPSHYFPNAAKCEVRAVNLGNEAVWVFNIKSDNEVINFKKSLVNFEKTVSYHSKMSSLSKTFAKIPRKKLKLDPLEVARNLTSNEESQKTSVTNYAEPLIEPSDLANQLLNLELSLNDSLKNLVFKPPVAYVYHPLDYAFKPHEIFTQRYCTTPKKVLFLGMNPGPWGMCQTGIPFGEVKIVREWFQIQADVSKPQKECPERLIVGLDCPRSEVSGKRIWGLFWNICGTPEKFFESAYMYNYCPIAMMKGNGGNVTPTEIKGDTQRQLEQICDETLYKVIQLLQVEVVVGVGKFAEARALQVLQRNNPLNTKVVYLLHPSPRVANNQNWVEKAEVKLKELNLLSYFK